MNAKLPIEHRRDTSDALSYAELTGFPVFVKPNDFSEGIGVTRVCCVEEMEAALCDIFRITQVLLVEKGCPGRDHRVVVLNGRMAIAYERLALSVFGDGCRSISQLIREKLCQPGMEMLAGRVSEQDPRIFRTLQQQGVTPATCPAPGREVRLLDCANLSTGGRAVDMSHRIHPSFEEIAVTTAALTGLALAGVDILCEDISLPVSEQAWYVLEVNASPGLYGYASLGEEQMERVKALYRQVMVMLRDIPGFNR